MAERRIRLGRKFLAPKKANSKFTCNKNDQQLKNAKQNRDKENKQKLAGDGQEDSKSLNPGTLGHHGDETNDGDSRPIDASDEIIENRCVLPETDSKPPCSTSKLVCDRKGWWKLSCDVYAFEPTLSPKKNNLSSAKNNQDVLTVLNKCHLEFQEMRNRLCETRGKLREVSESHLDGENFVEHKGKGKNKRGKQASADPTSSKFKTGRECFAAQLRRMPVVNVARKLPSTKQDDTPGAAKASRFPQLNDVQKPIAYKSKSKTSNAKRKDTPQCTTVASPLKQTLVPKFVAKKAKI